MLPYGLLVCPGNDVGFMGGSHVLSSLSLFSGFSILSNAKHQSAHALAFLEFERRSTRWL